MTSRGDDVTAATPGDRTESRAIAMLQFVKVIYGEEARQK